MKFCCSFVSFEWSCYWIDYNCCICYCYFFFILFKNSCYCVVISYSVWEWNWCCICIKVVDFFASFVCYFPAFECVSIFCYYCRKESKVVFCFLKIFVIKLCCFSVSFEWSFVWIDYNCCICYCYSRCFFNFFKFRCNCYITNIRSFWEMCKSCHTKCFSICIPILCFSAFNFPSSKLVSIICFYCRNFKLLVCVCSNTFERNNCWWCIIREWSFFWINNIEINFYCFFFSFILFKSSFYSIILRFCTIKHKFKSICCNVRVYNITFFIFYFPTCPCITIFCYYFWKIAQFATIILKILICSLIRFFVSVHFKVTFVRINFDRCVNNYFFRFLFFRYNRDYGCKPFNFFSIIRICCINIT